MKTNLRSTPQDEIFKATWRIGCLLPDEFLMETGHSNCWAPSKAPSLYYCSVTERTARKDKGKQDSTICNQRFRNTPVWCFSREKQMLKHGNGNSWLQHSCQVEPWPPSSYRRILVSRTRTAMLSFAVSFHGSNTGKIMVKIRKNKKEMPIKSINLYKPELL